MLRTAAEWQQAEEARASDTTGGFAEHVLPRPATLLRYGGAAVGCSCVCGFYSNS